MLVSRSFLILDQTKALGLFTVGWASTSFRTLSWSSGVSWFRASVARASRATLPCSTTSPPSAWACGGLADGCLGVTGTVPPFVPFTLDQTTALRFRHFVTSMSSRTDSCTSRGSASSAFEAPSSMAPRRYSILASYGLSLTFFTLDHVTAEMFLQFSFATSAMTMCASWPVRSDRALEALPSRPTWPAKALTPAEPALLRVVSWACSPEFMLGAAPCDEPPKPLPPSGA
mmetsp:Transcript_76192/g.215597  ORF Transcript_76192/g.215597 Transcript_76192/m.215597 type:complete len:230 (-) Transcript_76192:651-1340(-)